MHGDIKGIEEELPLWETLVCFPSLSQITWAHYLGRDILCELSSVGKLPLPQISSLSTKKREPVFEPPIWAPSAQFRQPSHTAFTLMCYGFFISWTKCIRTPSTPAMTWFVLRLGRRE